jgi:hypothetical protein
MGRVMRSFGAPDGRGAVRAGAAGRVAAIGAAGATTGREAAGDVAAAAGRASTPGGGTGITPAHSAHRARTPSIGTFAGSTRYTVSHVGQRTFIVRPPKTT